MAWGLPRAFSGEEGPRQTLKASGGYRGCGRQPTFPFLREGHGSQIGESWGTWEYLTAGTRDHEKVAVWAIPGTPPELRHLEGAMAERCCTQNQHDTHPRPDAWFHPTIAKIFHQPAPPPPPLPAKLRWNPRETVGVGQAERNISELTRVNLKWPSLPQIKQHVFCF